MNKCVDGSLLSEDSRFSLKASAIVQFHTNNSHIRSSGFHTGFLVGQSVGYGSGEHSTRMLAYLQVSRVWAHPPGLEKNF